MKELENYNKINSEIRAVKPIKKTNVLLSSLYPQRGHKCFEINLDTHEINEVEYIETTVEVTSISGENYKRKKILVKDNCTYITALNKKNALKKFKND